ncbi:uncharacterized protein LOC131520599 [Onychostoma macrolepis]|nr:uncharacterized protein LOC131520599 [Onychostoma macrolepis]
MSPLTCHRPPRVRPVVHPVRTPRSMCTNTWLKPTGAYLTGASSTRRKRKNKMEATMDVFAKNIKEALSQSDDTELQLKLQAAQHAHKLKMMTLFTQFLAGRQAYQPPPFLGHAAGSSSYSDHVHSPRFGQEYSHPAPFTQDHKWPILHQNDGHPCPPFYQDYVSAGPFHHSHHPFFPAERTPLLPPDTPPPQNVTTLQPPPSH